MSDTSSAPKVHDVEVKEYLRVSLKNTYDYLDRCPSGQDTSFTHDRLRRLADCYTRYIKSEEELTLLLLDEGLELREAAQRRLRKMNEES